MSAIPPRATATLLDLSADLWEEVTVGLRWRDIAALRRTCRQLREALSEYKLEWDTRDAAITVPTLRGVYHGIMSKQFTWNGNVFEEHYRNGKRHGLAICRYLNGTIFKTMPYKEGRVHGRMWLLLGCHGRGGVVTAMWHEGQRHGPRRWFAADGTLLETVTYTRGELHGPVEYHFPLTNPVFGSGVLLVGCCDHGEAYGTVRVLDKHGVAVASARYDRGVFVEDWALADPSNTLSLEVLDRDAQRCTDEWLGVVVP